MKFLLLFCIIITLIGASNYEVTEIDDIAEWIKVLAKSNLNLESLNKKIDELKNRNLPMPPMNGNNQTRKNILSPLELPWDAIFDRNESLKTRISLIPVKKQEWKDMGHDLAVALEKAAEEKGFFSTQI